MNTIWDYTPEDLTGLVRNHVDAVLAADAEYAAAAHAAQDALYDAFAIRMPSVPEKTSAWTLPSSLSASATIGTSFGS